MRIRYVKSIGAWRVYDKGPGDKWYRARNWIKFATKEQARKYCEDEIKKFPQYNIRIYEA